jgi:hypothetical protein
MTMVLCVQSTFFLLSSVHSTHTLVAIGHSENCPQSKQQQQFNNRLVGIIYHTAIKNGLTFCPLAYSGGTTPLTQRKQPPMKARDDGVEPLPPGFNYKKLRDRIRCYYKTHVQNSKKRLNTLLKNPSRPKNREILIRVANEVRSEGYKGPLSESNNDFAKGNKESLSQEEEEGDDFAPTVTFSASEDTTSPDDGKGLLPPSPSSANRNHAIEASPFRVQNAAILQSMRKPRRNRE